MLKDQLTEIVADQKRWLSFTDDSVSRELFAQLKFLPGFATIITGVRRSGKSTILKELYNRFPSKYVYLHFDDPRLLPFEVNDFYKLEDLYPSKIFLFDEIQHIIKWEHYIRYLVDRKQTVVITGSNATLLSAELGTLLTGRHFSFELFPFSFNEFETCTPARGDYLWTGGFPEFVIHNSSLILQNLWLDIIERDIINRYQIRSSYVFKEIALYLLNNIARPYSIRKLAGTFDISSANTVSNFIAYLENSYLFFPLSKFSTSFKKQQISPKKIYCIDNGLVIHNTVKMQEDSGRLFENMVFIHLRRFFKSIFYFGQDKECDFIVRDVHSAYACFQVCHRLHEGNLERELSGLIEAMNFFKLNQGWIITQDQDDLINKNDLKVRIINYQDFFRKLNSSDLSTLY